MALEPFLYLWLDVVSTGDMGEIRKKKKEGQQSPGADPAREISTSNSPLRNSVIIY